MLPSSGAPAAADGAVPTLGLRPVADGVEALADPGLANFGSTVQGGVLATVLAHTLDATDGGVELDVTFLRPVPADGERFTARSTPLHGGRRFAAGRAEVRAWPPLARHRSGRQAIDHDRVRADAHPTESATICA